MRKSVVLGVVTVLAMLTVSSAALANGGGSCRLSDLRGHWLFAISGVATQLANVPNPISPWALKCAVVFDRDGTVFDSRCKGDDLDPPLDGLDFDLFEVNRDCSIRANAIIDRQALAVIEGAPEGSVGCMIEGFMLRNILIASSHCGRTSTVDVQAIQRDARIRPLPPE